MNEISAWRLVAYLAATLPLESCDVHSFVWKLYAQCDYNDNHLIMFMKSVMFSCWASAHGCYVVLVKARGSWTILELESLGDDVYICSCSSATAEV